jgi:hypothetical protein
MIRLMPSAAKKSCALKRTHIVALYVCAGCIDIGIMHPRHKDVGMECQMDGLP